jgi:hypothetical protein
MQLQGGSKGIRFPHVIGSDSLSFKRLLLISANKNSVDKLGAGPTIYQIAFATAIAEVPADAMS